MSFPLSNDDVLLVSCEKDTDFGDIPHCKLKYLCFKKLPSKHFDSKNLIPSKL